jgi:uncharacterized alkaline shock family protein YloU
VRAATLGSYGVSGLAGGRIARLLDRAGLRQTGIRVAVEPGLTVDLDLVVAYGLPIAEVSRQVESAVRYSVRHALDRDIDRLTIRVNGLRYHPAAPPPGPAADTTGLGQDDLAASGTDVA